MILIGNAGTFWVKKINPGLNIGQKRYQEQNICFSIIRPGGYKTFFILN